MVGKLVLGTVVVGKLLPGVAVVGEPVSGVGPGVALVGTRVGFDVGSLVGSAVGEGGRVVTKVWQYPHCLRMFVLDVS